MNYHLQVLLQTLETLCCLEMIFSYFYECLFLPVAISNTDNQIEGLQDGQKSGKHKELVRVQRKQSLRNPDQEAVDIVDFSEGQDFTQ